jgi:hypothetical protein
MKECNSTRNNILLQQLATKKNSERARHDDADCFLRLTAKCSRSETLCVSATDECAFKFLGSASSSSSSSSTSIVMSDCPIELTQNTR